MIITIKQLKKEQDKSKVMLWLVNDIVRVEQINNKNDILVYNGVNEYSIKLKDVRDWF